ncbi:hypothetical protein [Paenibacillus wenxiniae]|uniref:Collagen triple helix repeat-containing protein n=1 Tax=Paenibacillus wenxiniae TaxID=1636843 RepID=A0ABW4RND0_9BACL
MTIDRNEIVQLQSRNAYLSFSDVQRGKKGDFFYIVGSDISLSQHDLTDNSMNYIVQADTVHLTGDLQLPGHDLIINARLIRSEKAIWINTSGTKVTETKDYKPNDKEKMGPIGTANQKNGGDGTSGQHGGDGVRGGNIILTTESFELDGDLQLSANGSAGGRGQGGGDGGDAASGAIGEDAKEGWFFGVSSAKAGGEAGNGGNGGNAGNGGNGGNAGSIFVSYVVSKNEAKVKFENEPGPGGEPGQQGLGKPAGKGGLGGREMSKAPGSDFNGGGNYRFNGERGKSGADGKPGQDGAIGNAGSTGQKGDIALTAIQYAQFKGDVQPLLQFIVNSSLSANDIQRALLASYEQQSMILHKASLAYIGAAGDEQTLNQTATLLQWLIQTMPDPTIFDQLSHLPATSVGQELLSSSIQWLAMRHKVSVLIWQLSQRLDYFGNTWNWTPLMSFNKYQSMTLDLITAAAQAESLYQEYTQAQQNQSKMQEILNKALSTVKDRRDKLETERTTSLEKRNKLEKQLHDIEKTLRNDEVSLEKTATEFVEALRQSLAMDTFKEMFNFILSTVALATSVGPFGAAAGVIYSATTSLLNSGKTFDIDTEGKDDTAIAKEKKEKEAELSKATANVKKTITSAYAAYKSGGSLIDLAKQSDAASKTFGFATTVVMTREQFEAMLEPVYKKVPAEKVKAYRKAFYDYLSIVENYQQQLLEYHAMYLDADQLRSELWQLEEETGRVRQLMGQEIDFSLPTFHSYILKMYMDSKQHLVQFLYEEYRAFRYMTLIDEPFRSIRDLRVAELSQTHADITRKITEATNNSENLLQSFQGLTFVLTEERFPEQFAALRNHELATFPLLLDNEALRDKIAGKAQMMVSNCQVYIPGAKTSSEAIHIEYEQSGYSTFLDPYGKRFDFIHRASHGYYEYEKDAELHAIRTGATQSSGGELQLSDNDGRILPGLLSVWSFQLPKEDIRGDALNTNLDLSETNQIIVIFKGKAKSYMRSATSRIPDQFKLSNKELPIMNDDEMYTIPQSVVVDSVTSSKMTHNPPSKTDSEQSINNIVIEW